MKFWEDIAVGERAEVGRHTFTADDIKAFARRFDPQPFHLDEAAAARSHFGALCASGWHTASVWMRLMVEHQHREDEARRARGEPIADARAVAGLSRVEMAQAGLCRRHHHLRDRGHRKARFQQPARLGSNVDPQHRGQSEGRAGDLLRQRGLRRAPQEALHERGNRSCVRPRRPTRSPARPTSAARSASPAARMRCTTATPI